MVVVVAALAGCGGSTAPSKTATPAAAATTPATSTSTQSALQRAEAVLAPPSFVIAANLPGGDQVRVDGTFGPLLTPAQSGLSASELSDCYGAADGREAMVKLTLKALVDSKLSLDVGLNDLKIGPIGGGGVELIIPLPDGNTTCTLDQTAPPPQFDFGTIAGQNETTATLWVVLDDLVTPNNPQPTAADLGGDYTIDVPVVYLNGRPVQLADEVFGGTNVIDCGPDIGSFIIVGGKAEKSLEFQGQTYPCHADPVPP